MKYIYLDNGATSFPKAPGVAEAISDYILNTGVNIGRGAYSKSYEAENIVYETRELLCDLFSFNKPENVIFTKNITEGINVLTKGFLKAGDHVIVSSMEHNGLMRPLHAIKGLEYTRIGCNNLGQINPQDILPAIRPNTRAVIMLHASNVSGTILALEEVGQICKENKLFFIIDSAQTAGFLDMDFNKLNADALAFTGHKSLLGPQGIGGFLVSDRMVKEMDSLIQGGTGSLSDEEFQPDYMPDKFEAGTPNIPGIYGLNASLKYIKNCGLKSIREKEFYLLDKLMEGLLNMEDFRILGPNTSQGRTPVVSLDYINGDNGILGHELSKRYGIMTRTGMHCAPSAHKTLGTFPHGTLRLSLSSFNSMKEINYTIDSINRIINKSL